MIFLMYNLGGILWLYKGLYRDNGKENGNYYLGFRVLGLYRDNGKENGSYYLGFRVLGLGFWGYIGIMEKKMEATI